MSNHTKAGRRRSRRLQDERVRYPMLRLTVPPVVPSAERTSLIEALRALSSRVAFVVPTATTMRMIEAHGRPDGSVSHERVTVRVPTMGGNGR